MDDTVASAFRRKMFQETNQEATRHHSAFSIGFLSFHVVARSCADATRSSVAS